MKDEWVFVGLGYMGVQLLVFKLLKYDNFILYSFDGKTGNPKEY